MQDHLLIAYTSANVGKCFESDSQNMRLSLGDRVAHTIEEESEEIIFYYILTHADLGIQCRHIKASFSLLDARFFDIAFHENFDT